MTIEVEYDDTSKQGKKHPIKRETTRDKEFAQLVHKVMLSSSKLHLVHKFFEKMEKVGFTQNDSTHKTLCVLL